MSINLFYAGLLVALANVLAWFQTNGQFVWDSWKDNPWVSIIPLAIPTGLCYWHSTRLIMQETNELWSARFISLGISYLVFPILTYVMLKESMFTPKTLTCTFLAFIIVLIQIYWR